MRTRKQPPIMWLTSFLLLAAMFVSPLRSIAQSDSQRSDADEQTAKAGYPALSRYAVDLNRIARQGRLHARRSYKAELNSVIRILSEDAQHNPALIGEAGEGSSAEVAEVAFGLARRIVTGHVPESLRDKQVFSLNLSKLAAGAKDSNEFVSRLRSVLTETAAANGQIILFVDQLHQFVGTYSSPQATGEIRQTL